MRNGKLSRKMAWLCGALALLLCVSGCGGAPQGTDDTTPVTEQNPEAQLPSGGNAQTNANTNTNAQNDNRPMIALTFDDGPHDTRTVKIVDELNKYGYHATFFVVGNRVDGSTYSGGAALAYAVESGNEIGIHGYTHDLYYNKCTDAEYEAELSGTRDAIVERVPGYNVRLMRPIGGAITAERTAACPYSVVLWDIDSEDWRYKSTTTDKEQNVNTIVENVMSQVHEGGIILMHDIYENTYEATVIILQRLHEMGYRVVSVSELLGDSAQPGRRYSSGN